MQLGKSPGLDGLTVQFYKFFWTDKKDYLIASLQHALDSGKFSISQRQGVIRLLPKKDKNMQFIQNWHPITLLSVDCKILTKMLANRLKSCIHTLVHSDQKAFIPGRLNGDNIFDVYSLIHLITGG